MRINFNLRKPSSEATTIRLIVTNRGTIVRKDTGIPVKTSTWRKPKKGRQCSSDPRVEERLKRIELILMERLTDLSTREEIEDAVEEAVTGRLARKPASKKGEVGMNFWQFFRQWAGEDSSSARQRRSTVKVIEEIMGDSFGWNDVDSAWYARLLAGMNSRGYSNNYKGAIITKIKTVMNAGLAMKYHDNTDFRQFKRKEEQVESVYLTKDELEALWNVPLTLSIEKKARDLFFLGVYTASRFSDYSRLGMSMVSGGRITFIQKKTGDRVIIPVSPRVVEVLERNGGRSPRLCQVLMNRHIKEVCRKAGITSLVTVRKSSGKKIYQQTYEKCELVSSHTARRTGATLLYMSGVPTRQCMMITGHRSEKCFFKYIRVTKEENADLLADNPFFKD